MFRSKLFMNSRITTTLARSLGLLTLARALCCLPLISAGQDAAPLPPAPVSPARILGIATISVSVAFLIWFLAELLAKQ